MKHNHTTARVPRSGKSPYAKKNKRAYSYPEWVTHPESKPIPADIQYQLYRTRLTEGANVVPLTGV